MKPGSGLTSEHGLCLALSEGAERSACRFGSLPPKEEQHPYRESKVDEK